MIPKIDEGDFRKAINEAIKKNRHVDYLNKVLVDYDKYKEYFSNVLIDKNPKPSVYKFKVSYLLKKPVWRIFEICGSQELDIFAEAITDSMEWCHDHLHAYSFPDRTRKNWQFLATTNCIFSQYVDDDPFPTFRSNHVCIENINYDKYPDIRFEFDFGDGHLFDIKFMGVRDLKNNEAADEFPKIVDLRGAAPEQYPPCEDE